MAIWEEAIITQIVPLRPLNLIRRRIRWSAWLSQGGEENNGEKDGKRGTHEKPKKHQWGNSSPNNNAFSINVNETSLDTPVLHGTPRARLRWLWSWLTVLVSLWHPRQKLLLWIRYLVVWANDIFAHDNLTGHHQSDLKRSSRMMIASSFWLFFPLGEHANRIQEQGHQGLSTRDVNPRLFDGQQSPPRLMAVRS